MTLQEQFEYMMAKAFPIVPRGTPQWVDMEQAFFAGCLVVHGEYAEHGPRPTKERMQHMLSIHAQLTAFGGTLNQDQQQQRKPPYGNN